MSDHPELLDLSVFDKPRRSLRHDRGSNEMSRSRHQLLSDGVVRGLAPPITGRSIRIYDTRIPCLCVRIQASGNKSFYLYKKSSGRVVEYRLGNALEISVDQARKLAQVQLGKIAQGVDVRADRRAIREESTLGELFDDYLESIAKPHKRTWAEDQRRFEQAFGRWRNRALSSITYREVQALHTRMGRENGRYAANSAQALLRHLFNIARKMGFSGQNPAQGIQRFQDIKRERFLDALELRRFLVAVATEEDVIFRDYFLLALLTGLRRQNLLQLEWREVDLIRRQVIIPAAKAKAGREMKFPLSPDALVVLARRRQGLESPWVFPCASSESGHLVEIKAAWTRILARAELVGLVDMLCEIRGDDDRAFTAAVRVAIQEITALRSRVFGRHLTERCDPVQTVLGRYRDLVRQAGLDPYGAQIRDLRPHDLRRTLGSWQASLGVSLPIIGRSLGHLSIQSTAIYARLSLDPVRESLGRAGSAMLEHMPASFDLLSSNTQPQAAL